MRLSNGLLAIALVMFVAACGGRAGGKADGDSPTGGDSAQTFCSDNNQCESGVCEGGRCVAAPSCATHAACDSDEYCHFPTLRTWLAGTTGSCSGACTDDNSCGVFGQECHAYPADGMRRCWTNTECTPGVRTDCPPGEVCSPSSHTCKWPKDYCYFAEECPVDWNCIDGTCIDPNATGECTNDDDCNDRPGCATGCTCNTEDGQCQVTGSCSPTPAGDISCGEDNYCASTICQPAKPCPPNTDDLAGHEQCVPYTLVCRQDQGDDEHHCGNPDACVDGQCAAAGFECKDNFNPPLCMPEGGPECTRDGQCPVGDYCNLPTSTCEPGCRDSADCGASCPGQSWCSCTQANLCNCNASHVCVSEVVTDTNQPCDTTDECAGGTVCAPATFLEGLLCESGLDAASCNAKCRQVCDLLIAQINDTCPTGEKCGGSDGGFLKKLLETLLGSLFTQGSSGAVCLPE